MSRYDCIVVGTGPAGLQAAVHLRVRNKNFLLLGPKELSKKVRIAPKVLNYLGLPDLTGEALAGQFSKHLDAMEIQIVDEMVNAVYPMGDHFALATQHNSYHATTVILAVGAHSSKTFAGEDEFLGRGVGYCATCDAPLYKGKTVAIIGYSDNAVREANFVAELAGKVYYIPVGKKNAPLDPRIILLHDKVKEIRGEKVVSSLVLENQTVATNAVFVLRESIAPTTLVPGLAINELFILTNRKMETNIAGCFAAGDCTGLPHQYIKSSGEGLVAAFSAVDYLDSLHK